MKINCVIEVDADRWAAEYGIDPSEVGADVLAYLAAGLGTPVDLRFRVAKK